eukprot:6725358-Prymnesium_polylepis.1
MMRTAEQCRAGTPHAGRRPCILPHGARGDMRAAAGEAAWDTMLRAAVGDLEQSTEALRRVYVALKAHAARVAGAGGLPSAEMAREQRKQREQRELDSAWMWHEEVGSEQS